MPYLSEYEVLSAEELGEVWAGSSAGYALETRGEYQFVAFYDDERHLTVGQRTLGGSWTVQSLDEQVLWDAHNYIEMTVDADGHVHLSGNMHGDPLVYFRTEEPRDVTTLQRAEMVGEREDAVTYPEFFRGPDGGLLFAYRDGASGEGERLFNVYDPETREWTRLLDEPILSGRGKMNAYPTGPIAGPDGYYHLAWVWRETPHAQTNRDVSYARSEDLQHWETGTGDPRELPITDQTGDIVDPVGTYEGLLGLSLGFDSEDRVIVTYVRYDSDGDSQVYNARIEGGDWVIYETSDWNYRWRFGGGGSIPFEVRVSGVETEDSQLTQTYEHAKYGKGKWTLDEDTLQPIEWTSPWYEYPEELQRPDRDQEDMQVNWANDRGESPGDHVYALRWETLEQNRDLPREQVPPPSTLRLYEFRKRTA